MTATDMTTGGSVDERLRWAFKMYDKDGSGRIEKFEMEEIIMILYELNGEPKVGFDKSKLCFFTKGQPKRRKLKRLQSLCFPNLTQRKEEKLMRNNSLLGAWQILVFNMLFLTMMMTTSHNDCL